MSFKVLSGLVLGSWLLLAAVAQAENPDHLRQLLQTNACENCDLSNADLSGLDLTDAKLRGANLSEASLLGTQLIRADLENADLSHTALGFTNLTGANLQAANLTNATSNHLCEMDSNDANAIAGCMAQMVQLKLGPELCDDAYGLRATVFNDVISSLCNPEDQSYALFEYTYLRPYYLTQLILQGANLQRARLNGADLMGADLQYADLRGAIATNADLRYTLLLDTDTTSLQGADLTDAWLTRSALGNWLVSQYQQSLMDARRAEAKNIVDAVNRGQQAYYLEYGLFSTDLDTLELGIERETDNYRYGMIASSSPRQAVGQYGLSKVEDLPSYLGFVLVNVSSGEETTTQPYLCESVIVGEMTEADLPAIHFSATEPTCPEGWQLVD